MHNAFTHTTGFTLIEILIAMAIMSIVAMVAVPTYGGYMERIEIGNVEADFVRIDMVMQGYWVSYGSYPPDLETLGLQKDDPWGNSY